MNPFLASLLLIVPVATPIDQSSNLTVDCNGITFSTDGYPENSTGLFSLQSDPPGLLELNSTVTLEWPNSVVNGAPVGYKQYAFFMIPGDLSQQVTGSILCPVYEVADPPVPTTVPEIERILPEACLTICNNYPVKGPYPW